MFSNLTSKGVILFLTVSEYTFMEMLSGVLYKWDYAYEFNDII